MHCSGMQAQISYNRGLPACKVVKSRQLPKQRNAGLREGCMQLLAGCLFKMPTAPLQFSCSC